MAIPAIVSAVVAAADIIALINQLLKAGTAGVEAAIRVSDLFLKRRKEGKDMTRGDLFDAVKDDDAAKAELEAAIAAAD